MNALSPALRAGLTWLLAMVSYYLVGQLGLSLAIPPGFASAVWPASGVALALAILLPVSWVVLGVFCGSFLVNLAIATGQFSSISAHSFIIPFEIAFGSTLQLLLSYCLFKRLIGDSHSFSQPKSIIQFSLLVVPFSCLVASIVGAFALYSNGVIQQSHVMFTWFTWWVGDAIGMFLFAPMLVTLFSDKTSFNLKRKFQVVIPSSIIFIFTCLLFFWSSENRLQKVENSIEDYAVQFSQKIHERLQISKNKLLSYQAYFQGSHHISFAEFNEFSQVLLDENLILHGIGWTEVISNKDRKTREAEIQSQGYPDFQFKRPEPGQGMVPVEEKEFYYPVLYIYPLEKNKRALGLDLSSLAGRLDILKSVEQDGEGRATPPITLVQGTSSQMATILYLPVWQQYPNNDELFGYVSGVYLFSGITAPVIETAKKENIAISVFDVTDEGESIQLIETDVEKHHSYESVIKQVVFENRVYQIKITPTQNFDLGSKDWTSWLILITGFILAALLQAFILMMTGTIEFTSRQVAQRTKQLQQATSKAQLANEAKSMFLANMSHELRTPLNAIVGLTNLCLKTNLNAAQQQYMNQTKLACETLVQLINQTLDYAKIDSGKLELEDADYKLSDIILKLHAIFSVQLKQKGVDFNVKSNGPLPDHLIGDALRIEQVLLNLLSNAYKFTESGSVSLSINFKKEVPQSLDIFVKDTGIGIPKSQQANLFESFRQADNSTTRKFGGTGLGLAISKKLIEAMGGAIHLNSDEGKGCEFHVELPIQLPASVEYFDVADIVQHEEALEAEAVAMKHTPNVNPLQGVNILVVEDIDLNRLIATEILESHGANVVCAIHGEDALEKLAEHSDIDLVLMDIQMPILDGYGATQRIREQQQYKDLPILAMTANAMKEDVEQSEQVGMNGHIAKPIDEEIMLNTILKALE